MPPLKTRSIRFTEAQLNELSLKYKGDSSLLFRALWEIFTKDKLPGMAILALRQKFGIRVEGKE